MNQPEGMFTYSNSALVLIDYQPPMFAAIRSEIPAEEPSDVQLAQRRC